MPRAQSCEHRSYTLCGSLYDQGGLRSPVNEFARRDPHDADCERGKRPWLEDILSTVHCKVFEDNAGHLGMGPIAEDACQNETFEYPNSSFYMTRSKWGHICEQDTASVPAM
jgi:hypothetical protein